jgi:ATP synthase protein I
MGNTNLFHKARLAVFRLSGIQLAVTVVLALLSWLFFGPMTAASLFSGGLIGMLAGFYQAQRMMRVDAGAQPEAFMRGLWVSEIVKIVLTAALFVAAIKLLRVTMVPTIVGYAGTYIVYWVMLGTAYPWFESPVSNNDRDRNWPDY